MWNLILIIITMLSVACTKNTDEEPNAGLDKVCQSIVAEKKPEPLKSINKLQEGFLKSHNDIRNRYGLSDLTWDEDIAAYAQDWADRLKKTNQCKGKHRPERRYGENLGWNWDGRNLSPHEFVSSPEHQVISWSEECKDYNYQQNKCRANEQCDHFKQVVWKNTKKLGCGMARCDGAENDKGTGRAEIWVCNYDPPGNTIGQKPY